MNSRKILYVIGSLDLGGAERHLVHVVPCLKQLGWEPTIYCLARRGIQAGEIEKSGVNVIGPPWETEKTQTAIGKLVRLIVSSFKLLWLLASRRPRIVHFFLPAAYLIGAPLAVAARVPIRVMSRRSLNLYQKKHPILGRIERLLHPRMQMLLANSKAVLSELREETNGKVPAELIYNGVALTESTRPTEAGGGALIRDTSTLILIIVANLIQYKGHADLFHALKGVADRLPPSWTLLCVGRDDGLDSSLSSLARELDIDRNIRLLGSRADIAELLASADIGILCSHEEGFSNAILEGMAAGIPMVVTNVGGNAESVIDRETGLIVPPHNSNALGAAILTLASNRELREQMGKAARRRVETNFSLDRCVQNYDALYRKLLQDFDAPQNRAG